MTCKLIVKSLAEQDIQEIIEWYADESKELASDFLQKLDSGFEFIIQNPKHFQKRYRQIRICFLKKFPY